jgi:hypothetical protein
MGLISRAIAGAAGAAGQIAEGHIRNEQDLDLRRQISLIEEQRAERTAEAAERRRREGAKWDVQHKVESAPILADAETRALESVADRRNNIEAGRVRALSDPNAEAEAARARAADDAHTQTILKRGTDPTVLDAIRNEANARDVGAAERRSREQLVRLQVAAARLDANDKQEARQALNDLTAAEESGDPAAIAKARRRFDSLAGRAGMKGSQSLSDVVGLAKAHLSAATKAEEVGDDEQAAAHRALAMQITASVLDRRVPGGKGATSAGKGPTLDDIEMLQKYRNDKKAADLFVKTWGSEAYNRLPDIYKPDKKGEPFTPTTPDQRRASGAVTPQ